MTATAIRAVGDAALKIEFGTSIDAATHLRVLGLAAALTAAPPAGLGEVVPSYASLLIVFDPLVTDPDTLAAQIGPMVAAAWPDPVTPAQHVVPVCYDEETGPDLGEAAARLGLSVDAVIAQHLAADYRVFMYGFAPGYAYLGGVPEALQLPRKAEPVRSRPVGSVMIAGGQCLVTTLPMPTGWWVIGRSPLRILRPEAERPFLFDPGDHVRFVRIGRAERGSD